MFVFEAIAGYIAFGLMGGDGLYCIVDIRIMRERKKKRHEVS